MRWSMCLPHLALQPSAMCWTPELATSGPGQRAAAHGRAVERHRLAQATRPLPLAHTRADPANRAVGEGKMHNISGMLTLELVVIVVVTRRPVDGRKAPLCREPPGTHPGRFQL